MLAATEITRTINMAHLGRLAQLLLDTPEMSSVDFVYREWLLLVIAKFLQLCRLRLLEKTALVLRPHLGSEDQLWYKGCARRGHTRTQCREVYHLCGEPQVNEHVVLTRHHLPHFCVMIPVGEGLKRHSANPNRKAEYSTSTNT